jgi:hypothetical protein
MCSYYRNKSCIMKVIVSTCEWCYEFVNVQPAAVKNIKAVLCCRHRSILCI